MGSLNLALVVSLINEVSMVNLINKDSELALNLDLVVSHRSKVSELDLNLDLGVSHRSKDSVDSLINEVSMVSHHSKDSVDNHSEVMGLIIRVLVVSRRSKASTISPIKEVSVILLDGLKALVQASVIMTNRSFSSFKITEFPVRFP